MQRLPYQRRALVARLLRTQKYATVATLTMENAVIMFAGLALAGGLLVLIDWLGRRKDRQSRNRAA